MKIGVIHDMIWCAMIDGVQFCSDLRLEIYAMGVYAWLLTAMGPQKRKSKRLSVTAGFNRTV